MGGRGGSGWWSLFLGEGGRSKEEVFSLGHVKPIEFKQGGRKREKEKREKERVKEEKDREELEIQRMQGFKMLKRMTDDRLTDVRAYYWHGR